MQVIFLSAFLCCTLSFSSSPVDGAVDNQLLSVIVVFRHGERSPAFTYANDPHKEFEWPEGLGQLTNEGKQRHHRLGQWFRKRYDGFLSPTYSNKEIYVGSTDVDRTLMSAASNLAGLYEPKGNQIWNENINWQPIPIHTANAAILNIQTTCTKFNKLWQEVFQTNTFKTLNVDNKELYAYLSEHTGENVQDISDAYLLRDTLFVESHSGMVLPDWTYEVFPSKLDSLAGLFLSTYGYTEDLARLTAGPFLHTVTNHFQKIASNRTGLQKFLMFSGHDSCIASILSGLGAFKPHCPYYGSTLIFELRRKNNEHIVNIFYKHQEDIEPIQLKGCTSNCKLDQFHWNLRNVAISPADWYSQCYLPEIIPKTPYKRRIVS